MYSFDALFKDDPGGFERKFRLSSCFWNPYGMLLGLFSHVITAWSHRQRPPCFLPDMTRSHSCAAQWMQESHRCASNSEEKTCAKSFWMSEYLPVMSYFNAGVNQTFIVIMTLHQCCFCPLFIFLFQLRPSAASLRVVMTLERIANERNTIGSQRRKFALI